MYDTQIEHWTLLIPYIIQLKLDILWKENGYLIQFQAKYCARPDKFFYLIKYFIYLSASRIWIKNIILNSKIINIRSFPTLFGENISGLFLTKFRLFQFNSWKWKSFVRIIKIEKLSWMYSNRNVQSAWKSRDFQSDKNFRIILPSDRLFVSRS